MPDFCLSLPIHGYLNLSTTAAAASLFEVAADNFLGIVVYSSVSIVLEATGWGAHNNVGTAVGVVCRSMPFVVVLLLWFNFDTARPSANNNKQQCCCCWSMSICSSGGTAVKAVALVAASFWFAVFVCCDQRSLRRTLAVLFPYGMVPKPISKMFCIKIYSVATF